MWSPKGLIRQFFIWSKIALRLQVYESTHNCEFHKHLRSFTVAAVEAASFTLPTAERIARTFCVYLKNLCSLFSIRTHALSLSGVRARHAVNHFQWLQVMGWRAFFNYVPHSLVPQNCHARTRTMQKCSHQPKQIAVNYYIFDFSYYLLLFYSIVIVISYYVAVGISMPRNICCICIRRCCSNAFRHTVWQTKTTNEMLTRKHDCNLRSDKLLY